jgi:branched-chain amino acid transport system substrate-binding protein
MARNRFPSDDHMERKGLVMKRMVWTRLLPAACFCLLILALLPACKNENPPIKVGYVGGLTGRVAGLGVAGRDAVLLAIEERNHAGGINGRRIELVSKDDQQNAEAAVKAVKELIDADVVAIIGPMTSSMAKVMQPLVNQAQVAMISPTVTSNQFNDQNDYFFRMSMPLKVNSEKQANDALKKGLKTFAVSLDVSNAAYTEDVLDSFRKPFEAGGGRIVHVERFKSGAEGGFLPLAERLVKARPDALLLLSGAMDTAMLAQQVRKLGNPLPLFTSEWAFTSDVINFGGKAVEEMQSYVTYNPASKVRGHLQFLDKFEKRFGYKPSFAAVLAYDASTYLLTAVERNPRREGFKGTLDSIGSFAGLQGSVHVSRYGDPERDTFLAVIRNGQFATID